MSDSFNLNFKNMLMYIGKAATQVRGCPMTSSILSLLIKWMFDDRERSLLVLQKYRENRSNIDAKYRNGNGASSVIPPPKTYTEALMNRDRSLFKHIDLFPADIASKYPTEISWFAQFLISDMDDRYLSVVWSFLDKIDKQSGSLH